MKYNAILVGSHNPLIDGFFFHMKDTFECYTSSSRADDISHHIKAIKPELLIFCIKNDSNELASVLNTLRIAIEENGIICVIIGDKDEVTDFLNVSPSLVNISLERPLTNTMIVQRISEYIEKLDKMKEEERKRKEEKEIAEKEARKHILIVDDDPDMLKLIKRQLEDKYNVATAVNGGLALRFLDKKSTDLILLDYEMPGQGGDMVLSILKRNESTKDIPVIFLTGVVDSEKIAKVLALKPQGYLLKPVDNKKLINEIKKVLGD